MAQTPTTTKLITQVPHMKTLAMYRRSLKAFMTIFKDDYEMFHRARIEFRRSIEALRGHDDKIRIVLNKVSLYSLSTSDSSSSYRESFGRERNQSLPL